MKEGVRGYLSLMLHRHMCRDDIVEFLSAFSYYFHALSEEIISPESVQEVADMCLLYVTVFPGRSNYKHEPKSVKFSSELGESLYSQLARQSEGQDNWFSHAYNEMAKHFAVAISVMRSLRLPLIGLKLAGKYDFPTDEEAVRIDQHMKLLTITS